MWTRQKFGSEEANNKYDEFSKQPQPILKNSVVGDVFGRRGHAELGGPRNLRH